MSAFLVRKLIHALWAIFGLIVISFVVSYFSPGNPATTTADQSVVGEFARYAASVTEGELGTSARNGQPVWSLVRSGVPISLLLGGLALLLGMLGGVPLGVLTARRKHGGAQIGQPLLWALYLLLPFVAVPVLWLLARPLGMPLTGWGTAGHWVLPLLTLTLSVGGYVAHLTRTDVGATLGQPYVLTARAKGVPTGAITWKHAFRNALPQIARLLGPATAFTLTALFVVEPLLGVPGFGLLAGQAVGQRDPGVVRGVIVLAGIAFIVVQLLADVIAAVLNPQLRTAMVPVQESNR